MVLLLANPARAQELEPQRWRHLPIDTNFLTAAYLYTDAEISIDPVLDIQDASSKIDTWALAYMRTFELLGKSAQVRILQPWQSGEWQGTVNGMPRAIQRSGFADTTIRFAVDLIGAPPLKPGEYAQYQATPSGKTVFGVAVEIQIPTGEYMDDRLINLGANQYVFRPEVGFVHERGPWSVEVSAITSFYTANDAYLNGNRLTIDPLFFMQANVLYRFRPDLWAAAGADYAAGQASAVNGVGNDDRRENILWGLAGGYSIKPWLGITFKYIRSDNQEEIGADSNRYSVSLSTFW